LGSDIKIQTFGCKVNHYDSVLLKESLDHNKINSFKGKEIFILNTCSVTAQAGKEARLQAKKIKKQKPNSYVVVTGCGAQVETQLYEKNRFIDLVVANSHKHKLPHILKEAQLVHQKTFKSNIFKTNHLYSDFVSSQTERTRSFVKIQDGCNSFCTFCIIPFARGKSQSVPISHLVKSVQKLCDEGVQEIVLTGVHIGDYKDQNYSLEDLLENLLRRTSIARLRLTSLEPAELTDRLLDLYKDDRMCPHFHLSIQSANDSVLKSMKRSYGRKDVEIAFLKLSQKYPKAFVGLDVIAGFPLESEQDFQETYEVLKDHFWTKMHVFPYSPREGTYAFRKQPLSQTEVVRRAGLLRHLSDARFDLQLENQIGDYKKVLIYKTNRHKGLSRDYWKVDIPHFVLQTESTFKITGVNNNKGSLIGVPA